MIGQIPSPAIICDLLMPLIYSCDIREPHIYYYLFGISVLGLVYFLRTSIEFVFYKLSHGYMLLLFRTGKYISTTRQGYNSLICRHLAKLDICH